MCGKRQACDPVRSGPIPSGRAWKAPQPTVEADDTLAGRGAARRTRRRVGPGVTTIHRNRAHPINADPPNEKGTRPLIWAVSQPLSSAPNGVVPMKPMPLRAITLPSMAGSVLRCNIVVWMTWNSDELMPITNDSATHAG